MATRVTYYKGLLREKEVWVVSRLEGGSRKRSYFSTEKAAKAEASRLQDELNRSGQVWNSLPGKERDALISAWRLAKEKGLDILELIAQAEHKPASASAKLEKVIEELIASKRNAGRSSDYLDTLELLLTGFAKGRESLAVDKVTLGDVETWLDSHNLASRATLRARMSTLFQFSIRRGYRLDNPCDKLEHVTYAKPPPAIFTTDQFKACITFLRGEHKHSKHAPKVSYAYALPWFVLSCCCGLRPEEAEKTTRDDIHVKDGWIRIEAQTTKVRQRRVVYPKPEAMALLAGALEAGKLPLDPRARKRVIARLRAHLGWEKWPKDITRHTAASYWLADCEKTSAVARSLGNSEGILLRDYDARVTKDQAKEFWQAVSDAH